MTESILTRELPFQGQQLIPICALRKTRFAIVAAVDQIMASGSPNDSDPVLINHSTADIANSGEGDYDQEDESGFSQRPPTLSRASTSALEKCWICLSTKDEDPPSPPNPPTAWRHPCSCTLQAHESCLLDWIADQESPRSRSGRSGSSPDKIFCPQCRSEIKVERPVDHLVQLCRRIDRSYSRLVLPGLATSLTGTILAGFWFHGRAAVWFVFGSEHARQIYEQYARQRWQYQLTYCFIPLNLIFARTRYADFVLPSGTILLLSTQLENGFELDWTMWPPLPSTVFACLPALRQFYNWSYEQAFGNMNRKWIAAVQPRREEGYEGQEGNIADILNEHEAELAEAGEGDGGMVLELEVNLGAVEEDEENIARDDIVVGGGQDGAPANGENQQNGNGAGGGRVHQLLGDNELMDDTSSIGQLVLGSLLIPAVASVTGEALKAVLPYSWTSSVSNFYRGRTGLLASQWGRSVVGGLAFIAVKDMLVLYCRWRLAEGHKKRRIMNFDKQRKEYVAAS